MKVLLHADIPRVGHLGDVVEVSDGYARNYLLPQRLAVAPTEGNVKAIQTEKARQTDLRQLALEELVKECARVNGQTVTLTARANVQGHLFGSITEDMISAALREQGFAVQSRQVLMPEHFRVLGTYDVLLHFEKDIEAQIKVGVVSEMDQTDDAQREQSHPAE